MLPSLSALKFRTAERIGVKFEVIRMKFNARLYIRPDTIHISGIKAEDEDVAYEKALDIALKKYATVCWELDELYLEEVEI